MRLGASVGLIAIAVVATFAALNRVTGFDLAIVAVLLLVMAAAGLVSTSMSTRRRTSAGQYDAGQYDAGQYDNGQYDNGTTLMSPYDVERSF